MSWADRVALLFPFALIANAALLAAFALAKALEAFPNLEARLDAWLFGIEVRD